MSVTMLRGESLDGQAAYLTVATVDDRVSVSCPGGHAVLYSAERTNAVIQALRDAQASALKGKKW